MTRRSNLVRREGGTYYARIYIPADLRDHFKSEDKTVSLRTKDEAAAKQRLYIELHNLMTFAHAGRSRPPMFQPPSGNTMRACSRAMPKTTRDANAPDYSRAPTNRV